MNRIADCLKKWLLLTAVLVIAGAAAISETYAWDTEQQALNDMLAKEISAQVVLTKYEKTKAGEVTQTVVPDAAFSLFQKDGTKISGTFTTDQNGQIQTELAPGSYYFEETAPAEGYEYDTDASGEIRNYPFTVRAEDELVTVTAYNRKKVLQPVEAVFPQIIKNVNGTEAPETVFAFLLKGASGNPMPKDAGDRIEYRILLNGAGSAEIGKVTFTEPGEYVYTVQELAGSELGWTYDPAFYTITFRVTEEAGVLSAAGTLTKDGERTELLRFVNVYKQIDLEEQITIKGKKIWRHGDQAVKDRPDEVIVYLYADEKLVKQRRVTAKTEWKYSFEVPRYTAEGKEIVYRIDEAAVKGYRKKISGYDLINTYKGTSGGASSGTETGGSSPGQNTPGKPVDKTKTGDTSAPIVWSFIAGFCLLEVFLIWKKSRKRDR